MLLTVYSSSGFFSAGSDTVSVKDGDSVTLHTGIKMNQEDVFMWFFNKNVIAEITGDLSFICTDVQCNNGTERFRDRLKLDHQTGSLTIMNTRTTDSGLYKLQISSSSGTTFVKYFYVDLLHGEYTWICSHITIIHPQHSLFNIRSLWRFVSIPAIFMICIQTFSQHVPVVYHLFMYLLLIMPVKWIY